MSTSYSSSASYSRSSSAASSDGEDTTTVKQQKLTKNHYNVKNYRDNMAEADSADEDEYEETSDSEHDSGVVSDNDVDEDMDYQTYRDVDRKERKKRNREEKKLIEKYQNSARNYAMSEEIELQQDDEALKQPFDSYRITLEPSENTTPIFYVKTKPGKEYTVIYKIFGRINNGTYGFVYSAFTRGSSTGYIYVEAKTFAHVQEIVNGIPEVVDRFIRAEPYKDMTKAIKIPRQVIDFKPGEFVEYIRNDKKGRFYKGDIGQVIAIKVNSNEILVKSIPRLDYELLNEGTGLMSEIVREKQRESYIPPQNYFDEDSIKRSGDIHSDSEVINGIDVKFTVYDNCKFYGGFLYYETQAKNIRRMVGLVGEDIGKKFEESMSDDFERRIPGFKEHMYQALGKTTSTTFRPGDVARILEGHEYENLLVDVKSVNGSVITVTPHEYNGLIKEFEIESELLEKHFRQGDKVEITAGVNRGKVGIVQTVNEKAFKASVLITSLSQVEDVELANLAHTKREEAIQVVLGRFRLEDYVILSDNSDGVIWRIEHDTAHIILSTGKTRTANLSQIKTGAREIPARSQNGQQIIKGAIIKIIPKHITATVLHTGRGKVFLKSDRGIFIADPSEIQVPNSITNDNVRRDVTGGYIQARPRQDLSIKGKTIRILGGRFKGQLGDVKEATDKDMKVFLHQTQKIVRIERGEGDKNFKKINDDPFKNKIFSSTTQAPIEENQYQKPQYEQASMQADTTTGYGYPGQAAYSPGGDTYAQPQYGSPGGYGGYGGYNSYGGSYASPSYDSYGGAQYGGQGNQYSPNNGY
jgi:transcription elongation factor